MPISVQTPIIEHVPNGVTTVFAYPFAILEQEDLKATLDGVAFTAFTVSGVGSRTGGSITCTSAPTGSSLILYREISLERTTDYQELGDLLAEVLDDDFDRSWMAIQDLGAIGDRCMRVPVGETLGDLPSSSDRALHVLGFNSSGELSLLARTDDGGSTLALDLLDSTTAYKGPGMVARPDHALNYTAGTLGAHLNEVSVSIMGFDGADSTGATSSDTAFAAAAALVGTTSGGYTLLIPKGTFVISDWDLSSKKGFRIQGVAGDDHAVIKVTGKITCNNTGYFSCSGVRWVGNIFNTTTRALVGSPTANNILFDMVDNCSSWDITGNRFEGFDTVFRPNAGATNGSYIINIDGNYFGWNNTSIIADGVLHWWVTNNMFSEDRVCNVWIKTGGGFHVDDNNTENSTNALSSGYNFRFGDGSTAVVANGSCDGNEAHQWYGVQLQKITQMSVSDNKGRLCKGARAFSIETSCTSIQVHDNVLNGYDGSSYMSYGVYISAPLERISVKTNQLLNFDVGVYVSTPGAYGTAVIGNQLAGVTNSISVTGVGSADYVVAYDNEISQGSIKSLGNTAAWVAGPNVFSPGVATQLVNTDGYARTGQVKKVTVNNNAASGYTVGAGVSYVAFTGTNVASLTINFPAATAVMDGHRIDVYTQAAVGTAVVFASTGATFVGAPGTLTAGSVTRFIFSSATSQWLPA